MFRRIPNCLCTAVRLQQKNAPFLGFVLSDFMVGFHMPRSSQSSVAILSTFNRGTPELNSFHLSSTRSWIHYLKALAQLARTEQVVICLALSFKPDWALLGEEYVFFLLFLGWSSTHIFIPLQQRKKPPPPQKKAPKIGRILPSFVWWGSLWPETLRWFYVVCPFQTRLIVFFWLYQGMRSFSSLGRLERFCGRGKLLSTRGARKETQNTLETQHLW